MSLDPAQASPLGSKCRVTTCRVLVAVNRLYCSYCWALLPISYKDEMVAVFDPNMRLLYQSQEFMQARLKADKYLNQTTSLLNAQKDQQKKKM